MNKIITLAAVAAAVLACHNGAPAESSVFELQAGEKGELALSYVRAHTLLSADVRCKGAFGGLSLNRGDTTVYWGAELHITPDSVYIRDFDYNEEEGRSMVSTREAFAHGLSIGRRLRVSMETGEHNLHATLSIRSGGRTFTKDIRWHGGGAPALVNEGGSPVKARLSFVRGAVQEPVWFLGDSYFSEIDPERWPYHMVREGYCSGWMADHIPGGTSEQLLESFKNDLRFGAPVTAVWMLGMNDKDRPGRINKEWLSCTQEFLSLCDSLGIEPVLVTVPSVPERCHDCKTAWVRQSGCRYIDWYEAVGASVWVEGEEVHQGWDEGLLYEDGVHPTESGAKVLWQAVKESNILQ